jgi:P-type E1-E2 ATPase
VDLLWREKPIARFFFDDELKEDVGKVFDYLRERGYMLGILTGDRKANAERLFGRFGLPVYAECSPEKKTVLVRRYQHEGKMVGMIGDGMNDAPALALADVGIVFSGTENSASIEAADVAILSRDAWLIRDAVHIGRRSYHVALQSILLGIGLSSFGMMLAFFGFIPPLYGAILQEVIDVVVIVNALRSTY